MGKKSRIKRDRAFYSEVADESASKSGPTVTARDLAADGSINADLAELRRLERRARTNRQRAAELVAQLREQGCSWAVIAAQLGITRQAATARYQTREG